MRFFVAQIIEALGFLHTKEIIYQDIKPENILLDVNGYVKLADFGAAKYVSQTKNYKTFVGTADYIAPEVLKKLPYNKSVDWWGLGILIFELLYGRTPFFNKNTKISFRMILAENPIFPEPSKISDECRDFICQVAFAHAAPQQRPPGQAGRLRRRQLRDPQTHLARGDRLREAAAVRAACADRPRDPRRPGRGELQLQIHFGE